MFPSPYGDMVLKFCFLSMPEYIALVSVPLRGYGFEMGSAKEFGTGRVVFPSPYGDMVLK